MAVTRRTQSASNRSAPARPARGRPKDPDKRVAILAAAKCLFTTQGVTRTSMDGIAQQAGVSKLTLYSHFENKKELLCQTVFAKCGEHWPEPLFEPLHGTPLRERLMQIGQGFLDLISSAEVINIHRLLVAEAASEADFGRVFWEAGPENTMQRVAQVLHAAREAGELEFKDARRTAAHFFALLKGDHFFKCLLGAAPPLDARARRQHLEDSIDLFLRAHAAPAPAPAAKRR